MEHSLFCGDKDLEAWIQGNADCKGWAQHGAAIGTVAACDCNVRGRGPNSPVQVLPDTVLISSLLLSSAESRIPSTVNRLGNWSIGLRIGGEGDLLKVLLLSARR